MKSNLESYIEDKREQLDLDSPNDEVVWRTIAGRLDARKRKTGWLWKAAAVLLIFLSVGSVSIYSVNRSLQQETTGISLKDISEELALEELAFRQIVYQKMNEVKQSDISPTLSFELYRELHQIDIQYDAYYSDFQEMGDNPKVIRGMIRCYEQKIKILEQTIREIEKTKRHENTQTKL